MLRRISLCVHGNMNLMYSIGAITPSIILNYQFLILVIAVFLAVINVSSATLVHCLLWMGCCYNLRYVCWLLQYFVNFIDRVIISIAFCIVLFLEGGGGCCLLFCLLMEFWFGVSFIFWLFLSIFFLYIEKEYISSYCFNFDFNFLSNIGLILLRIPFIWNYKHSFD